MAESGTAAAQRTEEEEEVPLFESAPNALETNRESDYFALLNLPRDASTDDVNQAYKRLSRLLHPDRHDASLKEAAEKSFQALAKAHSVLSDPKLRVIYEELGEKGLETNWEIATKQQTPAELRAEFERLAAKQAVTNLENLVKSRADLTVTLDARVLFLSAESRRLLGGPVMNLQQRLESVQTKQVFLKHSFTTPITAATSVVMTTQMLSRDGKGGGNLLVKVNHRPSSKLSLEIGTTLLRPRSISFKTTYSPDSDTFLTFNAPIRNLRGPPPLSMTIGRRITENNTATFTLRTGPYSIFSWGLSSLEDVTSSTISLGLINSRGWSFDATTGVEAGQLSGDYGTTVLGGVKVRVGGSLSSEGGWSTSLSGEKRLTENTRAALVLECGMNGSLVAKFRLSRLGQRIVVPVIIASTLNIPLIVAFTVTPSLSMLVIHRYVILPRKKRKVSKRIGELREENAEYIAEKKQEAESAVLLLREHVEKRVEIEKATNGLVIVEAYYGVLESRTDAPSLDSTGRPSDPRWLDVRIPLQSLIANSQLLIPAGRSKASLLGFYDCAISEKKRLYCKYSFKGRLHEFTVDDSAGVAAPMRAHWIE